MEILKGETAERTQNAIIREIDDILESNKCNWAEAIAIFEIMKHRAIEKEEKLI